MVCDKDTIKENVGIMLKVDNSLETGITTGDVVFKNNNDNKSILEIGNIKIYNTKKFNWLNRLMFRLFFGIKITNIK